MYFPRNSYHPWRSGKEMMLLVRDRLCYGTPMQVRQCVKKIYSCRRNIIAGNERHRL
jgi:hypothetical protein